MLGNWRISTNKTSGFFPLPSWIYFILRYSRRPLILKKKLVCNRLPFCGGHGRDCSVLGGDSAKCGDPFWIGQCCGVGPKIPLPRTSWKTHSAQFSSKHCYSTALNRPPFIRIEAGGFRDWCRICPDETSTPEEGMKMGQRGREASWLGRPRTRGRAKQSDMTSPHPAGNGTRRGHGIEDTPLRKHRCCTL